MSRIAYPIKLLPSPYGTRLSLSYLEDGGCEIEANVQDRTDVKRVRLSIQGLVRVSINDRKTIPGQPEYLTGKIVDSPWVHEFLKDYVEKFGPKLLVVVKNVEHFFVYSHDSSIEFLARKVEIVSCETTTR